MTRLDIIRPASATSFAAVGLVGQLLKFFLQVGRIGVLRELGQGKGVVAGGLQVGQLLAAHLYLLALGQALQRGFFFCSSMVTPIV